MDAEQLKTLAIRLAALTDALEERSQQAVQSVSASGERLDQTARALGQNVQWQSAEAIRSMGAQAQAAVTQGMQAAFDRCAFELQQAADLATRSAQALQAQHEGVQRAQRGLLWRASLALLVGAALAAGVSGFLLWKSAQAAQSAEFSEAILRATQSGAITQCDERLCVRVPKNAPRYSGNSDYVLVR